MSIRLQLEGAGTAKTQLGEVAKGVYGIAAAEKAAETAAKKRVQAQNGEGPGGSIHANMRAEHALLRSFGLKGPASHIAHAAVGTAGSSLALLGPAAAVAVASLHAVMAAEERHVESILEVNRTVHAFGEKIEGANEAMRDRARGFFDKFSENDRENIKAQGGPLAAALISDEKIKAKIEEAQKGQAIANIGGARRGEMAQMLTPGSAMLIAEAKKSQEHLEELRIKADNTGPVSRLAQRFGSLFGRETDEMAYDRGVAEWAKASESLAAAAQKLDAAASRTAGGAAY